MIEQLNIASDLACNHEFCTFLLNPSLVYWDYYTINIVQAKWVYSQLYCQGAILAARESQLLVRDYERMVICGKAMGVSW